MYEQINLTSLSDLNDEKAVTLIPAMLFFGLLMVVGIVGNSLVVYMFCVKLRSSTQNRLIIMLAVFDLLSSAIIIPNDIVDMRYFFTFNSQVACKTMRFVTMFSFIGSIITLLVIAADRFRKICRPLKNQMHGKEVKLSMVAIIVGALLFSWPTTIVYGLRTTKTQIPGLYGQDCSTPDDLKKTIWPLVYNAILFLAFLVVTVVLVVLYFLILNKTRKHIRYMSRNKSLKCTGSEDFCEESSSGVKGHSGVKVTLNSTLSSSTVNDNSNDEMSLSPSSLKTSMSDAAPGIVRLDYSRYDLEIPHLQTSGPKTICNMVESVYSKNQFMCRVNVTSQDTRNNVQQSTNLNNDNQNSLNPLVSIEKHLVESVKNDPDKSLNLGSKLNSEPKDSERASVCFTNAVDCEDCAASPYTEVSADLNNSKVEKEGERKTPEKSKVTRARIRSKTTMIAFLITLVFIVSFLPYLSLTVLKLLNQGFDYALNGSALVFFNIALRSYFINSVSNPIIYGVLNIKFREEVKRLMRRCFVDSKHI